MFPANSFTCASSFQHAGQAKGGSMSKGKSAHQLVRDQKYDVSEAAAVGLEIVKPFFDYQTLVLQVWANNCELLAHNYQRSLATLVNDIRRTETRRRDAA